MFSNFRRRWARIKDRVVVAEHRLGHPFEELGEDERAVDVTGVPCEVGYVADDKGNVSPPGPVPLVEGQPAYHDRSNPGSPATTVLARHLQHSDPHPSVNSLKPEDDRVRERDSIDPDCADPAARDAAQKREAQAEADRRAVQAQPAPEPSPVPDGQDNQHIPRKG